MARKIGRYTQLFRSTAGKDQASSRTAAILIWELMRTRREKLSATQLMRRNPSEAIVDRDNHLRDCAKYIVLSLPRPSEVPVEITREKLSSGSAGENLTFRTIVFLALESLISAKRAVRRFASFGAKS
jgi:hypothetical protein